MSLTQEEILELELEQAIIVALVGTEVDVTMGPIFHDTAVKPLTPAGAQAVVDRLHARGFMISKATPDVPPAPPPPPAQK